MQMQPGVLSKTAIQFFDNGQDAGSRECVHRIEEAGYTVLSLPTSGPPAIWIAGHEVVGRTAIKHLAEHLTVQHPFAKAFGVRSSCSDRTLSYVVPECFLTLARTAVTQIQESVCD